MITSLYSSDDIEEIRAAQAAARARRIYAETEMMVAETFGDQAAYNRAEIAFTHADDEVIRLGVRAEELLEDAEEEDARAERLEQRRAYWGAVL